MYNPATRKGGEGMFFPNSFLGFRDCRDGASNTLLIAEVKAWTPYTRNGGLITTVIPTTQAEADPSSPAVPTSKTPAIPNGLTVACIIRFHHDATAKHEGPLYEGRSNVRRNRFQLLARRQERFCRSTDLCDDHFPQLLQRPRSNCAAGWLRTQRFRLSRSGRVAERRNASRS